ncbi:MAG TPA: hypothetical protein VMK65_04435, partial [Longimicrobiales bacterium]|nr:hypothetical protein [Longimicrobiales bacterium]
QAEAEDRAHRLSSRVAALEAEEREFQGFAAPVAAALAARGEIPGLVGAVAEELSIPSERAAAVEAAMGALLQALVVRDAAAVERVRAWVAERGGSQGVLALVPESALPQARALLESLEFAGDPPGQPYLLGRRERLSELREEAARAAEAGEVAAAARREVETRVAAAEAALRASEERLRTAEHELKQAESDETARSGLRGRTIRHHEELQARHGATVAARDQARSTGATAREEAAEVATQLEAWRARRAETAGHRAEREGTWEAARDAEAELRVVQARAEGALAAAERRLADTRTALEQGGERLRALDAEEEEHSSSVRSLEERRGVLAAELQDLFGERDGILADLQGHDQRLSDAAEAAEELERRVRSLRRDTTERSEERHRLELQRAEAESSLRSIRERLEAEWGRPLEALQEEVELVEEEPEALRTELLTVTADLERLGPINMLAMEEHGEESTRLDFLTEQRDDLVRARDDLMTAIRRINRRAREHFEETFEQVRTNFQRTYGALFDGGECDVWLADPEDPLESPIEVSASPRGKRVQRINLLSGGERALTSLALLFAIYLVRPSPFCVLAEVDAPLDDANIARFVAMLELFKSETQFIVITHNPRTMEAADYIYGVTMEEPGVSKIVGVQLEQAMIQVAAAT